jgi:RHS repeat-associated protein
VSTREGEAKGSPRALQGISARSASYTYGPGGNRLSATIDGIQRTYEYNAASQLVKETLVGTNETIDYGYDTLGNQSTRVRKLGGVTQSTEMFGYNHLNLMSSYTNTSGSVNYQYAFWPTGDRYAKTNLSTSQSDIFVARGGDVVAEYQQIGAGPVMHKESYVQGTGMDQKVARVSAAGDRRHYVTNNVGTLTASLDDTGTGDSVVKDAWGAALSGSTSERFGGLAQREIESESSLTFVRNRMYDARTGRFTQIDPLPDRRESHHYLYARNAPNDHVDPLGAAEHHIFSQFGGTGPYFEFWQDTFGGILIFMIMWLNGMTRYISKILPLSRGCGRNT